MTLYEQISIIIFLGMFSLLVKDSIESARQRKFFREGYEEEKKNRREYRNKKYIQQVGLLDHQIRFEAETRRFLDEMLHNISHDLQQIKTRLTWSKKREKKDLKAETKLSTKTVIVHTKPRKHRK